MNERGGGKIIGWGEWYGSLSNLRLGAGGTCSSRGEFILFWGDKPEPLEALPARLLRSVADFFPEFLFW